MSGADTSAVAATPNARGARAALALVRRLEAEHSARADAPSEKRPTQQLFLPGMDDLMRAMPNHIARSSLFAPVARGRKTMHKDAVLVSRADAVIKIKFWGEQLDEAQADVWMQAMHEASKHPLGEPVAIRRASFLRSIGRHVGNYEYKWLHRAKEARKPCLPTANSRS